MIKLERCKELLGCWEQPDYRYRQILHAVFQNRVSRFQDMTVLPGELRQKLRREYIQAVTGNLEAQLENIYLVDEKGHQEKLKKKPRS